MTVLGYKEIARRIALPPDDLESLVVTPEGPFDVDSIDISLGTRFLVPLSHKNAYFEYGKMHTASVQQPIHISYGDSITIPARSTILGVTREFIKLPFDVSAQVLTRSSLARMFIAVATAPWVHPSWRGCLTLEINNASGTAVMLKAGETIAQLVLFQVSGIDKPKFDSVKGKYLGLVFPAVTGPE